MSKALVAASATLSRRSALIVALALAAVFVLQWEQWDMQLADTLYRWGDETWRLRHDPFVATILHRRAQQLTELVYVVALLAAVTSSAVSRLSGWRQRLWYAVAAMTVCYGIVSLGKAVLPIPCPWDLKRYGGYLPPGHWLQWQVAQQHVKGCFPSGHATGGYVMFAWYFVARDAGWRQARWLIAATLAAGLFLGTVQQVRGAHFLSHDVATAALCWSICSVFAHLCLRPRHSALATPP